MRAFFAPHEQGGKEVLLSEVSAELLRSGVYAAQPPSMLFEGALPQPAGAFVTVTVIDKSVRNPSLFPGLVLRRKECK
jgi:hypothetical protein